MELNFDVDIVYLWCDGNDPKFQKQRLAALESTGKTLDKDSTSNFRFIDTDELKYSLRSVEKFASWIRNIYIETLITLK